MKKYIKILIIIIFLLFIEFLSTYLVNEIIIKNYNNEKYDDKLINYLYFFNISEPYIAYYNHGNILYRNNNYEEAITKYEKALSKNPKKSRVCAIRINLSLSLVATVDMNNVEEAKEILARAKNNLYEDNCAGVGDANGGSEEADKLEKEIQELENELNGSESSDDGDEEDDDTDESEEKDVEERLKESRKEAASGRQEKLDRYKDNNIWETYKGKKW